MTTAVAPSLDKALRLAAATGHLLVASDFDGTLAEIVSRPELAVAHPDAITALAELAALRVTDAAVISGRSRSDLVGLTGRGRDHDPIDTVDREPPRCRAGGRPWFRMGCRVGRWARADRRAAHRT